MADNYCVTHAVRMNGTDYPRCTLGLENGERCDMRLLVLCDEGEPGIVHPWRETCINSRPAEREV